MSKIKILAVSPDNFGVGKYRILDPYKYISEHHNDEVEVDIVYDVPYEDNYFKKYQIVIFHSFIHKINHDININRIKWLNNEGIKTIMDVDDYWAVDPRHPLFLQASKQNFSQNRINLLQTASYVSTTTPYYRDNLMKKLGIKNVVVFPNAINPNDEQFKPHPIPSEKIRFGWLGGSSHLHDIDLLKNGIDITHESFKNKVQFVLCGFDLRGQVNEINKENNTITKRDLLPTETVWFKYESIFTKNYSAISENYKKQLNLFNEVADMTGDWSDEPYVRRWTRNIKEYATNYNYFDVSLAPLVNTEFNNNKSQLKAIESGFHKKPIIASEVYPYITDLKHGVNSLLVNPNKNHKEWTKHMKTLITNPNMIEDLGNALYETVKDDYSLKTVSKNRIEFFKTIV